MSSSASNNVVGDVNAGSGEATEAYNYSQRIFLFGFLSPSIWLLNLSKNPDFYAKLSISGFAVFLLLLAAFQILYHLFLFKTEIGLALQI